MTSSLHLMLESILVLETFIDIVSILKLWRSSWKMLPFLPDAHVYSLGLSFRDEISFHVASLLGQLLVKVNTNMMGFINTSCTTVYVMNVKFHFKH